MKMALDDEGFEEIPEKELERVVGGFNSESDAEAWTSACACGWFYGPDSYQSVLEAHMDHDAIGGHDPVMTKSGAR